MRPELFNKRLDNLSDNEKLACYLRAGSFKRLSGMGELTKSIQMRRYAVIIPALIVILIGLCRVFF